MSNVTFAASLAALLAIASPMAAQNSPLPPAQSGNPPAPAIHTTVNAVALDIVVRDKKGRPVKNVAPGDVQIYEDGVRQDIRHFRLVNGDAASQPTSTQPSGNERPDASGRASTPLRSVNLVCIVFQGLDAYTKKWAVSAAQEYIKTQLRPNTWVGVFNLDSNLTPLYPFSTNRAELLRAADKAFFGTGVDIARAADAVLSSTPNMQMIAGWASPGGLGGGATDKSTTGSTAMTAINGADVDNSPSSNSQRGDLAIEREQFIGVEGAKQMDQLKAMIRGLDIFPGHKTVLLFSSGLTTTGDPDQFDALVNKALAANISVYAFDSNGLNQTSTAQASSMAMQNVSALSQQQGQTVTGINATSPNVGTPTGSAGYEMGLARQGDYQKDAVRTSDTQSGLRALAEDTGGFLVANTNDLRKPFQQIGGEVETHYEADYRPSIDKYDGHFHRIEVKLARADWKAECREGYFAIPDRGAQGPLRPFEAASLLMLNSDPRPQAFPFRSAAFEFRPGADSQSAVVFELPAAALTAKPLPALKKHLLNASLFAVVKDSGGQIVDTFGKDFQYAVPDEQLAGVQSTPIDYRHEFNLPAGHYTVESVLLDREAPSTRASTSSVEFDSAAPNGVQLSSLMLVARADPLTAQPEPNDPLVFKDRELVPELTEPLKPSAKPMLYFVVYPDKSLEERPRLTVQFLVDGKELEQKDAELPAPDATGAIPVLVNAATRPGDCELRITAIQGFQKSTRSLKYTVAAQ